MFYSYMFGMGGKVFSLTGSYNPYCYFKIMHFLCILFILSNLEGERIIIKKQEQLNSNLLDQEQNDKVSSNEMWM